VDEQHREHGAGLGTAEREDSIAVTDLERAEDPELLESK
jgi:hypothetical protein